MRGTFLQINMKVERAPHKTTILYIVPSMSSHVDLRGYIEFYGGHLSIQVEPARGKEPNELASAPEAWAPTPDRAS